MELDPVRTFRSFAISIVVRLIGMNGVAPVGSFVHLRRGTVDLGLVRWLSMEAVLNG